MRAPVLRVPAWRWFLPRLLRGLVMNVVLMLGLVSVALAMSMQQFIWIDSQRFGHSIGTTVSLTTVSSTPTNAAATAFSNQKKEATLSIGREVVVVGDTTTNAKFYWSDDGWATKTDFGSDIAGWSNGSISSYVDSGGTERLVAVWKQSGTGGSRTDQALYVMVGTFNAGRTTLSWGTPQLAHGGSSNTYFYPDVVAHAEGTGGVLHFVNAEVSGSNNWAEGGRWSIDSSGVLGSYTSHGTGGLLSTNYANSAYTYPSIDIDPTTKRLLVAWSAGTTGAGNGIRFRTAAYSAGSWTWATEVEVDNTFYQNDVVGIVSCRWDAGRSKVIVYAHGYTGSVTRYRAYESSSFTSFGSAIISVDPATSADRLEKGSIAIDGSNGDIYVVGIDGGATTLQYRKWTRATATLGSLATLATGTFGNSSGPGWVHSWYSSLPAIRSIWTEGASSPYTVKVGTLS